MGRAYDVQRIEGNWRGAWRKAGCFRAPERPAGPKFFNYDSGPFPNGPLHMGHVRTYVLGDVTARYQRLLGKSVLYCTELDAFGLPTERAALEAGMPPRKYTSRCIALQKKQLVRLGISYDWERVPSTCDPAYYRWTQVLFLALLARGLVERRAAELNWCPRCETTLARMQVDDGRCWRCETAVEARWMPQWFVLLSRYSRRLREGLGALDGWSNRAKSLLLGFIGEGSGGETGESYRVHDWLVSRQRAWGTPIPIIYCETCGAVPVPAEELPVRLPDELDWSLGQRALASCAAFVEATCPRCAAPARRETDTLDCFFDDVWCMLACLMDLDLGQGFERGRLNAWLPVDRFHSGFDTFFYLHLHRFLGLVLHEEGLLDDPELIRGYQGHDMVLAGGRKMSKHLGNAVSPRELLLEHGSDALRIAVMWAAGPQRTLDWSAAWMERAAAFLDGVYRLVERCAPSLPPIDLPAASGEPPTRAASAIAAEAAASFERVGRFIDEYRPNAAVAELAKLEGRLEAFALRRVATARLSAADAALLRCALESFAIALAPFAPHLAEELWRLLGHPPFVCQSRWPGLAPSRTAP